MNFNGAVKGDNEKLHKFVQVWGKTLQQYNLAEEKAFVWADVEFEKLNWLQELCYTGNYNVKYYKIFTLYKRAGNHLGMFSTLDEVLVGLEFLPNLGRWSDLFWKAELTDEIISLVQCGEPVYLNPTQAKLVEDFINMKEIEL